MLQTARIAISRHATQGSGKHSAARRPASWNRDGTCVAARRRAQ